jgi:hypothetical protein
MESIYDAPAHTIRTNSGLFINVFETDPDTIAIEDMAHALSMMPRFGGHLNRFYSVCQHSIMCCNLAMGYGFEYALAGLLHDGSEAYLLDMPTPIKNRLPDYKSTEHRLMEVIAVKYGFEFPLNPVIKKVDAQALEIEWDNLVDSDNPQFVCMTPAEAKEEFLRLFHMIMKFQTEKLAMID